METLDWNTLGFGYRKCDCNIRTELKGGVWGDLERHEEEYIKLHISAPSLHYGSQIFEGLKAFRGVDGKIRIFRADENAKRMVASAERLYMKSPSEELFIQACVEAVRANERFVPPAESGASLYIRPLLIATDAVLGIKPAQEYIFIVFVSPVGAYFKGGLSTMKVVINTDFDRAAPRGTGAAKCGGNYAASLYPGEKAHEDGFSNVLYLDAAERIYVEECGAANFFGIKNGRYITPQSPSILRSITNMSLRQLAADMGLEVEQRAIHVDELSEFEECGACGTAAVISPIGSIYDPKSGVEINYGDEVGPTCRAMFERLQDIQYGRCEDPYGWTLIVE